MPCGEEPVQRPPSHSQKGWSSRGGCERMNVFMKTAPEGIHSLLPASDSAADLPPRREEDEYNSFVTLIKSIKLSTDQLLDGPCKFLLSPLATNSSTSL